MSDFAQQIPVVEQDPTEPAFVQNPYHFYRLIRALGNFVYWKNYALPVATTHAAVQLTLRHPKLGRAVPNDRQVAIPEELEAFYALECHSMLELEPPEHTRLRRLATQGFGSNRIATIAPEISRLADALIDEFPSEPFDLIEAYAKPLAARAITAFLGIEAEHAKKMQQWSNSMVAMYQARRDADIERDAAHAAKEFATFIKGYIANRRGGTENDFLSQLIGAEASGTITANELVSTVVLLLNAGHEATAHSVGNAVRLIVDHSERALMLAPDNIAATVEECLRFSPPLHMFCRYAYEAVDIMDVAFPAGTQIGCLLGSACRDDALWPDADQFDPFRARRPHIAFGSGLHSCVGAPLARLEMQIALPALFSRCPGLKIVEPPTIANLYHFHGLEELSVTVR